MLIVKNSDENSQKRLYIDYMFTDPQNEIIRVSFISNIRHATFFSTSEIDKYLAILKNYNFVDCRGIKSK